MLCGPGNREVCVSVLALQQSEPGSVIAVGAEAQWGLPVSLAAHHTVEDDLWVLFDHVGTQHDTHRVALKLPACRGRGTQLAQQGLHTIRGHSCC